MTSQTDDSALQDTSPMDASMLQARLMARTESLKRHVAARTPPRLATVLAAEDVLQEVWTAVLVQRFLRHARWIITPCHASCYADSQQPGGPEGPGTRIRPNPGAKRQTWPCLLLALAPIVLMIGPSDSSKMGQYRRYHDSIQGL